MGRWGRVWYDWALHLLPEEHRRTVADDMRHDFDRAQADAMDRGGRPALTRLWIRELFGLLGAAFRARRPDAWSRRTEPGSPNDARARYTHADSTLRHRPTMDTIASDLRFAARTFVRRPGLLLLAVLTLSLGIGASTAMFSVINAVLLRPLDFPEPEQIQAVYPAWPDLVGHPTLGDLALRGTWSWPELWLVAEQQDVFERFAGYAPTSLTLFQDGGRPERVRAVATSWELFPMLGASTRLGRTFDQTDGVDGDRSVLLSYDSWTDRFGSDPSVLGSALNFNERSYTVLGVLEEGFKVPGTDAAFWIFRTGSSTDAGLGNHGSTRALGRLAQGVSAEQAQAQVTQILQSLPVDHGVHESTVASFQSELTRGVRPVLIIMLAASGLLLIVACGNVAALLLGAGIDRERELAVRGAVGASRGRLAQQLLTESMVLAVAGAAGGATVAVLATRALAFLAPPGVPRLAGVAVDGTVLMFSVVLAVVCGVAFGLLPALSLSSTDLAGAIGSNRTTSGRRARLQSSVVIGELALATVLVVGGLLLARTVSALNRVDPGFEHEGLVALSIAFPSARFDSGDDDADLTAAQAYRTQITEALASAPGVTTVHSVSSPPFFGWRANNGVAPEGWADPDNGPVAERRFVSPGYFESMGIPILEGRGFEANDEIPDGEWVTVVSEGLADLAWPNESAVGKRLEYWGDRDSRVIGVVGSIRDEDLETRTDLAFYAPAAQGGGLGAPYMVRVSGDATAAITALRERVWSVDPNLPITRIATVDDLMSDQLAAQRYRARLMTVFAALAGLFAVLGIYGVTARSVARRTQEMGLRVALGADRGSVHAMVTKEAVRLAVVGVVVGIAAAVAIGGVLERFLWGVSRADPVTLAAVGIGLPLLAALAAVAPARRATNVDPLQALKAE